jgi:sugar (pentulose or hexulose) kinase
MVSLDTVNIVIDIGSSGIRAVAFTISGRALASAKRNYETYYPHPGWAEQNPHDWEDGTLQSLAELVTKLPRGTNVNALSFTGQCPSYVPVDRDLRPLGNVLTYQDNRSILEAEDLAALVGVDYIHDHSGHSIEPFFILPKVLWHRREMPELFARLHKVLQPSDYLEYFLTGNVTTDPSYACGTLAYDRYTRGWNGDLLGRLGMDASLFPERIVNSWDVVGTISNDVADRTGLPRGLRVVRGGPDSQCCSLGVAAIETDVLSNMSGTSTCLNRTMMEIIPDLRVGNYMHVLPERWSAEVGLNTTGVSLKKVAGMLFPDLEENAMYAQVNACVDRSPAGSNGLLYFPYLSNGERDNQDVKGGFYNMSMMTSRDDMMRAVLEGVAFAEKERADLMMPAGEKFSSMRISGGGASSDRWCQIKSDVMGIPVLALKGVDAADLGAALLAVVGTGLAADFTAAIDACELHYDEFTPDPANASMYQEKYNNFLAFEKALSLQGR